MCLVLAELIDARLLLVLSCKYVLASVTPEGVPCWDGLVSFDHVTRPTSHYHMLLPMGWH